MRNINLGAVLAVRAIAGLHVVTLAWDFVPGQEAKRLKLLGFAIERTELAAGVVFERFWLRGIKRFRFKDEGLPPGSPVPTSEHPVQSFQWGDYIAKPSTTYRYRIVPLYGKPNLIEIDDASSTTVEITTEDEAGGGKPGVIRFPPQVHRIITIARHDERVVGRVVVGEAALQPRRRRLASVCANVW